MRFQNAIRNTFLGAAAILSTAASAATLSVNADKLTYLVGETVTLTVTGDDGGATAYYVLSRLEYSGALVDNGTRSQMALGGSIGPWTKQALLQGDDGTNAFSEAFSQLNQVPQTATNLPDTFSTVTLIAKAVGVVDVNWNTQTGSGFELAFFGLTNAPGMSFTIVPEPATVALIALGLLGLAGWRRASA